MTNCPYCSADTSAEAYVHPESGNRYCGIECASKHVGVADWYGFPPHADPGEHGNGPWRSTEPMPLPGEMVPVPAPWPNVRCHMTIDEYREVAEGDSVSAMLERVLRAQIRTGGFHPEDDAREIIGDDCIRTFDDAAAIAVNADVRRLYALGIDVCAVLSAAFPAHMNMAKWEADKWA